jgi:tetratricopeptide (TPR) repeat protein
MKIKPSPSLYLRILPLLLLAGAALLQYYLDKEKIHRQPVPSVIIPAQAIRTGDLGLHSAASTIMWIYTIQRMADYSKDLPEMIKTINDIDPRFSYPYAFSTLVLPPMGFIDQAIEIGIRGINEADPDWRIPYYLATTYHIFLKDRKNAAYYFNIAANTPEAPENIKSISARYGSTADHRGQTKQIWISIYETSNDEVVMERAKNNIIHLEIIEALEKAITIYRQRYGYYPKDINDLVTKKILRDIPESPLGVKFRLKDGSGITVE